MARVTVEECLKKIQSGHFDLILLSTERSQQIIAGKEVNTNKMGVKTHITALREIEEEKVNYSDLRKSIVSRLSLNSNEEDNEVQEEIVEEVDNSIFLIGDSQEEEDLNIDIVEDESII